MPAGKYRLIIEKGATLDPEFVWSTKDANGVKTPVNLTGYEARAQVRPNAASAVISLDMTTGNGRIVLGGEAGTIALNVPPDVTAALTITTGEWDLELVSPSGRVKRLLKGPVQVDPEVTRD